MHFISVWEFCREENRLKGIIEDLRPMLKDLGINSNNMENDKHLKSVMGIMKEQIKNFKGRNKDLEGIEIVHRCTFLSFCLVFRR